MNYCINPLCNQRQNYDEAESCSACGTPLLINDRIRLVEPLRPLNEDPFNYFEVFEVDDAGTQWNPVRERRVMKVLKWNDKKLVELIRRESLALQLIRHPNVPSSTIDDYFTFTPLNNSLELHCLIMQKIEGQNLRQWVNSYGRISQSLAIQWLKQLVEILDLVHRSGFFHRDIKPDNIIIQPNGQLALIDFNGVRRVTNTYLAKVSSSGGTSTGIGSGYEITDIKTANYSPLEQINGQAVPQSDFYALGKTFVYLVTGISLSRLKTDQKSGRLIWRYKAPHIDKPFADFLDELMSPFPGQRPQNTQIVLQRLERIPFQTKLHRIVRTKSFKVGVISLSLLVLVGTYKASLPGVANYLFEQGKKAQLENRPLDAQKDFQLATKLNPNVTYSVSSFFFGQASRYQQDNPKLARKYYELAIIYNPNDIDAYNNLALVCQQVKDLQCISNSYENLFKLKPNSWEGHYNLGSFYDDRGEYELAEQQYRLAIKLNSNSAVDAMTNLSRLLNKKGKYAEANALSLQALAKTKNSLAQAAAYKNIGWSRFKQKRYLEAEDYLHKATNLDAQRVDAYCLLAQVQEALGEISEARISWEVCLIAQSSLPEVQVWRQQILHRLWRR